MSDADLMRGVCALDKWFARRAALARKAGRRLPGRLRLARLILWRLLVALEETQHLNERRYL